MKKEKTIKPMVLKYVIDTSELSLEIMIKIQRRLFILFRVKQKSLFEKRLGKYKPPSKLSSLQAPTIK